MAHTPGPWEWVKSDCDDSAFLCLKAPPLPGEDEEFWLIVPSDDVAMLDNLDDAPLIAAAPDLLEAAIYALGKLDALCRQRVTEPGLAEEQLRAAIAKAGADK